MFRFFNFLHQTKLRRVPNEHVDFCLKVVDGEFFVIESYRAQSGNTQKIISMSFETKYSRMDQVKFWKTAFKKFEKAWST